MQNGAVVNLGSLSVIQVNPDSAAYIVAKAAQDLLLKTLARQQSEEKSMHLVCASQSSHACAEWGCGEFGESERHSGQP